MKKKNILIIVLCAIIVVLLCVIAYFVINNIQEKKQQEENKPVSCIVFDDYFLNKDFEGGIKRGIEICQYNDMGDIIANDLIPTSDNKHIVYNILHNAKTFSLCYIYRIGNEEKPIEGYYTKDMMRESENGDTLKAFVKVFTDVTRLSAFEQHIKIRD